MSTNVETIASAITKVAVVYAVVLAAEKAIVEGTAAKVNDEEV